MCARHFQEQEVIHEEVFTRADGSSVTLPRKKPKLKEGAVPTIFPGQPSYMTSHQPEERQGVARREANLRTRDDEVISNFLEQDIIQNFKHFSDNFKSKSDCSGWIISNSHDHIFFGKLEHCGTIVAKFLASLKVFSDMSVIVYYGNSTVSLKPFSSLLSKENKLTAWTSFDSLLSRLSNYNESSCSNQDKIYNAFKILDEEMEEKLGLNFHKYCRLKEQMLLLGENRKRYSSDLMIFACNLYYSSPSSYHFIRENSFLSLPSVSYLRKLGLGSNVNVPGITSSHINYLKERISDLNEDEKLVNVLLDEIHVKSNLQYKAGKIQGSSDNSSELANCIQTFMVSSLFSSRKDVVALFPVKGLTSSQLKEYTKQILSVLHSIGYKVLSVISDNNRINRKMFEDLCGGELKPFIQNPHDPNLKLFFLFDTVHILKCIRNNWLNEKAQEFLLPSFEDFNSRHFAELQTIKEIYRSETNKIVKLAPTLSYKVLFPSSFERQNVNLVLNLFNEKTIAAIKTLKPTRPGEVDFMSTILKWWNIVNVKSLFKGQAKRLEEAEPIHSTHSPNLVFLERFVSWLESWQNIPLIMNDIKLPSKALKLSLETYTALHHTSKTLTILSKYLLTELKLVNFNYVLLGKFQTDNLERRFGLYRRMSGCNYHISVTQVLESEKKLKIMNLLRVRGANSDVSIHSIFQHSELNETHEFPNTDQFVSTYEDIDSNCIEENDRNVLIYISGYVAHSVKRRTRCEACSLHLSVNKILLMDIPPQCTDYVNLLDRGGLQWPTDFVANVCFNTFLIFQNLIKDHEREFRQLSNQKNTLAKLSLDFNHGLYVDVNCCSCRRTLFSLMSLCVQSMANILLNNYTKSINNSAASQKNKRKLGTLT